MGNVTSLSGLETDGLSAEQFREIMDVVMETGAAFMVLRTATPHRGTVPAGIVRLDVRRHIMEPHVLWFPWSSIRNRFEATARFLDMAGKEFLVMIYAAPDENLWWRRLSRLGLLSYRGLIPHYLAVGKPAELWISARNPDPWQVQ